MHTEHFDVLVVGAGLSGIDAGYHLQTRCPNKRYAILEGRDAIGGTWDLFRYPGIRSDSDMFTLGYPFRPWRDAKSIADGPSILRYVRDTAREFGIDRHIRFRQTVRSAAWSTRDAHWTLEVDAANTSEPVRYTCDFLYLCSGYYSYARGHAPAFPGSEGFAGPIVHPQEWPEDLDYRDQRVVVIGSGATAVTLVPAMADRARHVTMLQRSPTYIVSLPSEDGLANAVRRLLPDRLAHRIVRWKNVLLSLMFFQFCRRWPERAKRLIRRGVAMQLPEDCAVDTHFRPTYDPWDQRLCIVPEGDLFKALRDGRASIVTDRIDRFTTGGIRLQSGRELAADIIVTATGLKLVACGGIHLDVDGRTVDPGESFSYKGVMLSGVPNMAVCVGYTNASWTLRADLTSRYVCRLLNYMDRKGYDQCVARLRDPDMESQPLLNLTSGYVRRSVDEFPKQGSRAPWKQHQNYLLDLLSLKLGAVDDRALEFSRRPDDSAESLKRTA